MATPASRTRRGVGTQHGHIGARAAMAESIHGWASKCTRKRLCGGKRVLVFQTWMGHMPGKLRFRWTGPYWIVGAENDTFQLGTSAGEVFRQKVNGFRLKPYLGPTPPNPFHAITDTADGSLH